MKKKVLAAYEKQFKGRCTKSNDPKCPKGIKENENKKGKNEFDKETKENCTN